MTILNYLYYSKTATPVADLSGMHVTSDPHYFIFMRFSTNKNLGHLPPGWCFLQGNPGSTTTIGCMYDGHDYLKLIVKKHQ